MIRYAYSRSVELALTLILGCAIGTVPACAMDLGEAVQVHGFLSQSAAITDDNDFGGTSSEDVALDLREIGANVSWRPDPDWLLSAQALMRWAGETDRGALRLDYGFVDRTLLSDDLRLGIQLGKIKNPYGFHNTTRDVAHTRPGVIMPQSIYLDRIRNFFLAAPGASLYGEHLGESLDLSWQANLIRPEVNDKEMEYMFRLRDGPGHYKGNLSWYVQGLLEIDNGRWRLGLTLNDLKMTYSEDGSMTRFKTRLLSMEHNRERWSFTGEYALTDVLNRPTAGNPDNTVEAYYLQATWRFRPGWQVYARRDVIYLDKADRDGSQFYANTLSLSPALATLNPPYSRFAKDYTLGLRYDPTPFWSLFVEYHDVEGTAWLPPQDNPYGSVRDWNLFLIEAAYRF